MTVVTDVYGPKTELLLANRGALTRVLRRKLQLVTDRLLPVRGWNE